MAEGWRGRATSSRARTTGFAEAEAHVAAPGRGSSSSGAAGRRARRWSASRDCWPRRQERRSSSGPWASRSTRTASHTIQALVNVGLARGWVGREKVGLMPIRGHSGVQGGAEVGCAPGLDEPQTHALRGGVGLRLPVVQGPHRGGDGRRRLPRRARRVLDRGRQLPRDAARSRPRPRARCARVGTRIHQDIVLTSMMLLPPGGHRRPASRPPRATSRPAAARRPRPSAASSSRPRCAGRRIGSAQAGVGGVRRGRGARAARPRVERCASRSSQEIRDEIARAVPLYAGIERLARAGRPVPVGRPAPLRGRPLRTRRTARRASPCVDARRTARRPEGTFHVSTRRGKQFNSMVQRDARSR